MKELSEFSNSQLNQYIPVWQQIDFSIMLDTDDYSNSQKWRTQAEKSMITDT